MELIKNAHALYRDNGPLTFHTPGPLGNSFLISMFRNIDLWSGAIDVRISVFFTQQDRGREIRIP